MQKTGNWQRIWNDDGSSNCYSPVKAMLYVISLLYRLIITLRNRLYDRNIFQEIKLPCPVISVGNITVGGTGKTPCVIWIAQMLQKKGFKPAVLSRGYGGKNSQPVNIVSDGDKILVDSATAGDEPYLIARSLPGIPVFTGPQRILTGKNAIDNFGVNVLICDDAFQHRQIFRNINLVLLDSQSPLGNGHMLPRGSLREPVTELRRADAIILTRTDETKKTNEIIGELACASDIPVFVSSHKPVDAVKRDNSGQLQLTELKGKKVCAFAGIAKPDSFKKAISATGAQILSFDIFPDHHRYTKKELENIHNNFLKNNGDLLITTEKDGMRLQEFPEFSKDIYLLRIKLEIVPDGDSLKNFILEKLRKDRLRTEG
ncbi:MAG: tetraacyldisaccharide 4'-kinase [Smithellaceae bacterium]